MKTRRIFVEKKNGFRIEERSLRHELNEELGLSLKSLRIVNIYDLFGFSDELAERCRYRVFGEIATDTVSDSCALDGCRHIAVEYIPGQFDQRASSAVDCVHLLEPGAQIRIRSARLYILDADTSDADYQKIRHYLVNPVECRVKDLGELDSNEDASVTPMESFDGFTKMPTSEYRSFCQQHGLAMNEDDLAVVVDYFRSEGREPTETELRILDTYWSDHCRHTTFTTDLTDISIEDSFIKEDIADTLQEAYRIRHELKRDAKSFCLMELATIGARYLKRQGVLDNLEESDENNACSIYVNVDVDGRDERWLLQFKNETHNHPTEIEPFGGAATCLGGAIRDPLSGRAYVYQAMRVTGAGDICLPVEQTMPGKLPQRVISKKAAHGYSSYGNQIGLATTLVREVYDDGYCAKRMEVGAVVGAVKADNVRREQPAAGDVILLLGGRTGRDGVGGATGSSKTHTENSLELCGSEVQKGNAPEERKLQRLFRRPEATRLIKKSNDFGAGGVSVAIGELAPGLDIYLDRVPVKYAGINATELAISESQERMAVVVEASKRAIFEELCRLDNIEVTHVADVTDTERMRIYYKERVVCDLRRSFIDSAGARHQTTATISAVDGTSPLLPQESEEGISERVKRNIAAPNAASQKGLVEMFDSTIGRSTVLMPYGGRRQATETQVSVQKLPTDGFTHTASVMSFGFSPEISRWSPYHGAAYAVVEACAKVVAAGGNYAGMRFSYQEYFEKMTSDPRTWGKPLSALLGGLKMQLALGLPSIGGKDSMSGSFESINVPPTLIAFGITTVDARKVISPEFKKCGSLIYLLKHKPLPNLMPDTAQLSRLWAFAHEHIMDGTILSAWAVGSNGVAEALCKMGFGNMLGCNITADEDSLFSLSYGSLVVEVATRLDHPDAILLGEVTKDPTLTINGTSISLAELEACYTERYSKIYPTKAASEERSVPAGFEPKRKSALRYTGVIPDGGPIVCLPVFPGSNCDYDTAKAFRNAGAQVRPLIFRNLTEADVNSSIAALASAIDECQILAFCGGFSCGDEPDGSGKFIASVIGNEQVARAIGDLQQRHGLILGICNGFQALVKSGLLPFGKIGSVTEESPTLFRNDINRHISLMAETEVVTTDSPWLRGFREGERHSIAFSHGEGKFMVNEEIARQLFENGQVAFRYVENPNGSHYGIEGILSPDGLILGKMGHSERYEENLFKNISGNKYQPIFENAVRYFL